MKGKYRPQEMYRSLEPKVEQGPLAEFTIEQQKIIKEKQKILSSLAQFIGKDFYMPVELNKPGEGWHWDFKNNIVRIDPVDLLEKSMDYLRFVISHEGGHRRISRMEVMPAEEWQEPGFSFMTNAIEDPRDNNFVAESYPVFREQMKIAYTETLNLEADATKKAKEELGFQPRFKEAGFEYIYQWFRETEGLDYEISSDLPQEVQDVVKKTLASASDSWWRFPSREEADNGGEISGKTVEGEEMIVAYANASYVINRQKIWPEFKKLVEADIEDQKMQEFLKDIQENIDQEAHEVDDEEGGQQLPQDLKDSLTKEEQEELIDAIKKALDDKKSETAEDSEGDSDEQEGESSLESQSSQSEDEQDNEEDGKESEEGVSKSSDENASDGQEEGSDGETQSSTSEESMEPSDSESSDDQAGSSEENDTEGKNSEEPEGNPSSEKEGKPEKSSKKPVDLDSLSQETKKKIKDYIDSLPQEDQKKLKEQAKKSIKEFEEELSDKLEGKLSESPDKKDEKDKEDADESEQETDNTEEQEEAEQAQRAIKDKELDDFKERLSQEVKKHANVYETTRAELLPVIDKLEQDLREIFVTRKKKKWESGHKKGKRIDIKRRIQEKAKSVPVMESKAWQTRELPDEKDYAISLLVDLSGSMQHNDKIKETFKAIVVLSEVLNRLSISLEILGFNDRIYEYQSFGKTLSKPIRQSMGGMLKEVSDFSDNAKAMYNDDGWALSQASERLNNQKVSEKFLIVFSDGQPEESALHPKKDYDLASMIAKITDNTDQKLIGLGIGNGTGHVDKYYPHSISNIDVTNMVNQLAQVIKDVIQHQDNY